jgi:lysophospholipase L1-like esterase
MIDPADADDQSVTWESSDDGVATVAGTGLTVTVSAVSAGTATITVKTTDGNFTGECSVTVEENSIIKIFMAGDSTMCIWDPAVEPGTPYQVKRRGWGEFLQRYFDDADVQIFNLADSGESSKTFLALNNGENYNEIKDNIGAGDYLFVQFGHNDEKDVDFSADPEASHETEGTFKWYLYEKYVKLAKDKGAIPVLFTPVCRREDSNGGKPPVGDIQDHGIFDNAVRQLAETTQTALVDLEALSGALYNELVAAGGAAATAAFMAVQGSGAIDNTHFAEKGAWEICNLVAEDLKRQSLMTGVTFNTMYAESVSLPEYLTLEAEASKSLTAEIYPRFAANQEVTWSSNAEAVATASGPGLVGTVNGISVGTATITVRTVAGNLSDTCAVTVTEPIPSIPPKLIIKNQSMSPGSGTTPDTAEGEGLITLTGSNTAGWAWTGTAAVTNAGGDINSGAIRNSTMAYLDTPMTRPYTMTAKITRTAGTTNSVTGLIFAELANPASTGATGFTNFVGFRHLSNGAFRGYYIRPDGALQTANPNNTLAMDSEYTYEIKWDGSTYSWKIETYSGSVALSGTGTVFSGREASYHPGIMVLSQTLSISELRLTLD